MTRLNRCAPSLSDAKSIAYIILFATILLGTVFLSISFAQTEYSWEQKIAPDVSKQFAAEDFSTYIVLLEEQANLDRASSLKTKEEKGQLAYQSLLDTSLRTQASLIEQLEESGTKFQSYWIANMILVESDVSTMTALAERKEVAQIVSNPRIYNALPESEPADSLIEMNPWNIETIQSEDIWALGISGDGVVIGGQDTGYEWQHPALIDQYRGWNGSSADHNYNWHDAIHTGGSPGCEPDSQEPCDDQSHGTHTIGIAVGDGGPGYHIGVAPGAQWIGCRNMDQGVGTPATYAECYQWFLAPTDLNGQNPDPSLAPDIITNSWSCPVSEGCTDPNVLNIVVENIRAAGIISVHSAGNNGPACSTVNDPAAIYDASFSVGAVNQSGDIASFSSRGPVLVDGSVRLKPDISAPGVSILSSVPGGGYGYKTGTSMAAPHAAGLAALAISAYPSLRGNPEAIERTLKQMANPRTSVQDCGGVSGSQVPNNTYGYGTVNAANPWLALEAAASERFNNTGKPITLSMEITHIPLFSQTHDIVITTTIPSGSVFISATSPYAISGDKISWDIGDLEKDDSAVRQLSVLADKSLGELIFSNFEGTSREIQRIVIIGPPEISLPRGYYYPLMFVH